MSRKRTALTYSPDTPFDELPTLILERLANTLSKHGELMYRRLFGLHLSECRVLSIAHTHEPLSLRDVCEQLELDKGHVSRMVTKLVAGGLLERRPDPVDQRVSYLIPTAAGREIAQRIRGAAAERNRDWIAGLHSEKEAAAFVETLKRLTEQARKLLANEATTSGGVLPRTIRTSRDLNVAMGAQPPLVVERPVLEEIRRQLDRLLDHGVDPKG